MRLDPAWRSACTIPRIRIAGMAHAILPRKEDAVDQGNPYKFAREGASELIRAMVNSGAEKKQITAKLVGRSQDV